jgi:glycosyltransferase involved in cell wall biosynthesis
MITASVISLIRIDHVAFSVYLLNLDTSMRSINQQILKDVSLEKIVVDFGSIEKYSKKIKILCKNHKFKYVKKIANHWNRSSAINFGIQNTQGEYVLPLDADLVIPNTYVMDNISACESSNKVFSINEVVDALPTSKKTSVFDNWNTSGFKRRVGGHGNVCVSRSALLSIGGYDENYNYWGAEDNDLVLRLRYAGYKHVLMLKNPIHLYHLPYTKIMKKIGKFELMKKKYSVKQKKILG